MEVHHEYADQAAAYALGALTPQERADFEAHLANCARCAAEVRSFAPVDLVTWVCWNWSRSAMKDSSVK